MAHVLVHRRGAVQLGQGDRGRIADDMAVPQLHDAGGVLFGQFRVVRDHDNQAVIGDFLEQFHDLHRRGSIQGAGRFVRQQDIRVIDQGPGNGNSLHLAAGHLVRFLVHLITQTDLAERFCCPLPAFTAGDAADGQRQFDIGQDRLMGNQIVTLEDKADRVVAVAVPVAVLVAFRGDPVDDQVAAVIPVQTADNVQKRGLA